MVASVPSRLSSTKGISFVRGAELHLLTAHRTRGSYEWHCRGSQCYYKGLGTALGVLRCLCVDAA